MEGTAKVSLFASMLSHGDVGQVAWSNQATSTATEKVSSIANTGYADSGPHRPQHELLIQVEDPNIIYRVIAAMPSRP